MSDRPFWVFLLTAVAGEGCAFPLGEKHAVLAAALGTDEAQAGRRVDEALLEHGWTQHALTRSGLVASVENAREGKLREVVEAAVTNGCALLAYEDVLD